MIGRLFASRDAISTRIGDLLDGDPQDWLVVTQPYRSRGHLLDRAEELGLEGAHFRMMTLRTTLLAGRRHVGLRAVERRETVDLLKVYENTVAVRFEGEYRTLKMSRDRFVEPSDRHLLRNSLGQVTGIYHAADRRYLRRPRGESNNESPRLLDPEEDFTSYRTVRIP